MSRRFADRYVDPRAVRSFTATPGLMAPRRTAGFVARAASGGGIAARIGGLESQVTDLLGDVTRRTERAQGIGFARRSFAPPPVFGSDRPGRGLTARRPSGEAMKISRAQAGPSVTPPFTPRTVASVPTARPLRPPAFAALGLPARVTDVFGDQERAAPSRPQPATLQSPDVRRGETAALSTDDAPQDYRRLGPTALRDTLRRRGGPGVAPDFALRERLRGPLRFDPAYARLHMGLAAADAARALSAQAFTIGRDVFFGPGRYEPTSAPGLELIAHELTHVGQQARLGGDRMRFFTASGGDALEQEAQQTAAQVGGMTRAARTDGPGAPSTQAYPEPVMQLARMAGGGGAPQMPPMLPAETFHSAPQSLAPTSSSPSPRAVADRVYDLMRRELTQGGGRGQSYRKG